MPADKGWARRFDEPIPLLRGRKLVTLKDAGNYITKLPKAEHAAPEWLAAMEALILVATHGGPTMFARIGIMQALNRHHVREFDPKQKEPHWGRRKLARVNTSKHVGDAEHLKVFANVDAAETWFEENDPEGVAFEYEVLE
jgi:hypothetical protein